MSQEPRVMGPENSQETRCEDIVRERVTRKTAPRQPCANSMAEAPWP